MMEDYSYLFKIILVGDANVGKTCLVRQFTKGYFPPNQGPTIGVDFTIKTVEVDGEKVKLQIWDTAGQERFRSITQSYYHNADGVIVTYDITNKKSFENMSQWIDDTNRYTSKDVLMAVVGNKSDLKASRQVDFHHAEILAEKENTVACETSAKDADNVEQLFMSLATHLKRNLKSESESTSSEKEEETKESGLIRGMSLSGHTIYTRGHLSCCRV